MDEYLLNERSMGRIGAPLVSYNEEEQQLYNDVIHDYESVLSTDVQTHAYFPLSRMQSMSLDHINKDTYVA